MAQGSTCSGFPSPRPSCKLDGALAILVRLRQPSGRLEGATKIQGPGLSMLLEDYCAFDICELLISCRFSPSQSSGYKRHSNFSLDPIDSVMSPLEAIAVPLATHRADKSRQGAGFHGNSPGGIETPNFENGTPRLGSTSAAFSMG